MEIVSFSTQCASWTVFVTAGSTFCKGNKSRCAAKVEEVNIAAARE